MYKFYKNWHTLQKFKLFCCYYFSCSELWDTLAVDLLETCSINKCDLDLDYSATVSQ